MRLLAACGVTAVARSSLSSAGSGRPTAAVPACLAVGVVCAALWATCSRVRARRRRLAAALAVRRYHGRLCRPGRASSGSRRCSPTAARSSRAPTPAARYLIWHVALLMAGGSGRRGRARRASCSSSAPPGSPSSPTRRSPPRRSATSRRPTAASTRRPPVVGADRRRAARGRRRVVAARRRRADLGRDVRDRARWACPASTRSPTCSPPSRTRAPGGPASTLRAGPVRGPGGRPADRLHRRRRPAARVRRTSSAAASRPSASAPARGGARHPRPAAPRAEPSAASQA